MIFHLFIFAFVGITLGAEINLTISPGPRTNLIPKSGGPSETKWNLKTAKGAKMVMYCALKDMDCSRVNILIWNGKKVLDVCDEQRPVAVNNSVVNEMSVTIRTRGSALPAICQVSASIPYMNFVEKHIDSSEHGRRPGAQAPNCRCGWTNKRSNRIVNGKEAGINEYPFPVLIMKTYARSPFCGGSIITRRHVLTAAHCTEPFRGIPLSVIVGEHDVTSARETPHTKIIDVSQAIDHEMYNNRDNAHDISLLFLKETIQFSDFVGPVCLPSIQQVLVEEYIKVMGWGLTQTKGRPSPVLRKVHLKVIEPKVCEAIYGINPSKKTQICTFNHDKDSCQGDSGGPLVWLNPKTNMYTQVGLVSYGMECASTDPAVNTDVAAYMKWIEDKISRTDPSARVCTQ